MTDCYMYILSAECTKLFHDFTISLSPKGSRLNWVKMETTNTVCILVFSFSGIYMQCMIQHYIYYLLMSPSRISTFPNCGEWRTLMFW